MREQKRPVGDEKLSFVATVAPAAEVSVRNVRALKYFFSPPIIHFEGTRKPTS
jgi:hypothetical protein